MKQCFCLLLLISVSFFFITCKKDKPAIDQLPPATQTGAHTLGCLVNGKVFKPKGDLFSGPILSCAYQYIDSGYNFQLHAKQDIGNDLLSIGIFTNGVAISEGVIIKLYEPDVKGKSYGLHGKYSSTGSRNLYYTQPNGTGELHITKLDEINRIVSGTFWFDGINDNGEKVEVREGRFDTPYTL